MPLHRGDVNRTAGLESAVAEDDGFCLFDDGAIDWEHFIDDFEQSIERWLNRAPVVGGQFVLRFAFMFGIQAGFFSSLSPKLAAPVNALAAERSSSTSPRTPKRRHAPLSLRSELQRTHQFRNVSEYQLPTRRLRRWQSDCVKGEPCQDFGGRRANEEMP